MTCLSNENENSTQNLPQWQETEIDPGICKISKHFFRSFFSESPSKITHKNQKMRVHEES